MKRKCRRHESPAYEDYKTLRDKVMGHYGLTHRELETRSYRAILGKRVIAIGLRSMGYSLNDAGLAMGVDHSSVHRLCKPKARNRQHTLRLEEEVATAQALAASIAAGAELKARDIPSAVEVRPDNLAYRAARLLALSRTPEAKEAIWNAAAELLEARR